MRTGSVDRLVCISRWQAPTRRRFSISRSRQDERITPSGRGISTRKSFKPLTILSGIQPTGVPHLGNYLGALRQWKDFQEQSIDCRIPHQPSPRHKPYFSVVDLHALTSTIKGVDRNRLRKESFASLLAIGLRPPHSALFFQSDVPAHSELMWILSTIASTGYLSRMTQWKSKLQLPSDTDLYSDIATEKLKLGLFSYPVLQAADILLYRPDVVPVGEDQAQHIEFARNLARSFNSHFGKIPPEDATRPIGAENQRDVFNPLPEALISPAKRIMSLRDPTHKMSKSHTDSKSRILITDNPEEIHAKLRAAVTDSDSSISYSPDTRPGVSNLIEILKHTTRSELSCEEIGDEHRSMSKQAFKELVGDEVAKALAGVRERFEEVMQPGNKDFEEAYWHGLGMARDTARTTMDEVRRAVGLEQLCPPRIDVRSV
jgi:tryptophanyl-tRNA synthetase